ncbi:MAG: glycosyltransferase family 2 protein [Paracoccaceae bacterium]
MTQSEQRVGVVIRTKDRPMFVPRALRTVIDQTFPGWHIVLVNDGGDAKALARSVASVPATRKLRGERLTIIDNPQSVGRSEAFNIGLRMLQTEFVCCLDDDDSWDPTFLAKLLALHDATVEDAPDLGGVMAHVTAIREDLRETPTGHDLVPLGNDPLPGAFSRADFFVNPIAYATYRHDLYPVQWMLRREAALAVGGFPVAFDVMEDRAFLTRFLQHWRLAVLPEKLAFHHRRPRRQEDARKEVTLNTLDNPSYDWRKFADLAKVAVNTPDDPVRPGHDSFLRALATSIVKEINDETSTLWHKVNSDSAATRARIDALDARIGNTNPVAALDHDRSRMVWSLWDAVGPGDIGYGLSIKTPFLGCCHLSMHGDQHGLLLHASHAEGRVVMQIPATENWAAFEVDLAGMRDQHSGLEIEFILSSAQGFLFETALSEWVRDGALARRTHRFSQSHVHSCAPGSWVHVRRSFDPDAVATADSPRFSIILPRRASDFRLVLHDFVVHRPAVPSA